MLINIELTCPIRASAYKKTGKGAILGMVFWEGSHGTRNTTGADAHYDLFFGHTGPPDRA
jgi:hypothetical protein